MPKIGEVITDFKPIDNEEIITDFKPITETPDVPRETTEPKLYLEQGKPQSFSLWNSVMGLFDNPEKEAARAVEAVVLSETFKDPSGQDRGITPSVAYTFADQLKKGIAINPVAAMKHSTITERINQSWEIGKKQNQTGELGYKYITSGDSKYLDEIKKVGMPTDDDIFISQGTIEDSVRSAAKLLPMMIDTAAEGGGKGLTIGMGFGLIALIAGQPELIPAVVKAGFMIGSTEGAFEASLRKEGGLALAEIINFKDAQGKQIDPNIARASAFGIGVINAGIEVAQISTLLKTIPGARELFSKAILEAVTDKTVKQKLLTLAGSYGKTIATETGQEVAQESTNIVFEALAKAVNNNLKGTDIKQDDAAKIMARLKETAVESAKGFAVIALPGYAMQTAGLKEGKPKTTPKVEAIKNIIEEKGGQFVGATENTVIATKPQTNEAVAIPVNTTSDEIAKIIEAPIPELTPEQKTEDLFKGFDKIAESDALETMTDDEIIEELSSTAMEPSVPSEAQKQAAPSPLNKQAFISKIKGKAEAKDINTWVLRKGGINYEGEHWKGELRDLRSALNQGKKMGYGNKLIKAKGAYTLDQLAIMAKDEGFLTEATPQALLDAMHQRKASIKSAEELPEPPGPKAEIDPGSLKEGDKVFIDGEEFRHRGFDDNGNILLRDGLDYSLDIGDKIEVDATPEGKPIIEKPFLKVQEAPKKTATATQLDLAGAKTGLEGKLPSEEIKGQTALEKATEDAKTREAQKGQIDAFANAGKPINDIFNAFPAIPEKDAVEAAQGIDIEGRISRGNLQAISPEAAVVNYIRHEITDYDEIITEVGKEQARAKVQSTVNVVMNFWKGQPLSEFSRKDIKRLKEAFGSDTIEELEAERTTILSPKSKPRELHTYKVGDVVDINGKKVEIKKIIKDSFGEPQRVSVHPVEKITKTIKDKTFDMPQKAYDISPFTEITEGEAKLAVGKVEEKDISAADDVIKNVFARIDTILGKGTVSAGFKPSQTILDSLSTNVKQKALGEHGLSLSDKFSVAGLYQHTHTLSGNGLKHIITFAEELKSDPKGLKRTGYHEGWHGAEEILESLAASGNQEARAILKTLKNEIQLPEARAEAFADFGMGKTPETLSAKVRAIFERIMRFFRQLGDYLAGRGITSKAEVNSFFEKVWQGEFADKAIGAGDRTALSAEEIKRGYKQFLIAIKTAQDIIKKFPNEDIRILGSVQFFKRASLKEREARSLLGVTKTRPDLDIVVYIPEIEKFIQMQENQIDFNNHEQKQYLEKHIEGYDKLINIEGDTFFRAANNFYRWTTAGLQWVDNEKLATSLKQASPIKQVIDNFWDEARSKASLDIKEFSDFSKSLESGKFGTHEDIETSDYADLLKKDYNALSDRERTIVNNLMADEGMLSIKDINKQTRKTMSEWTFKEVIESDAELKAMIIKAVRAAREAFKAGNKAGVEAEKAKIISLYQRRKKINSIRDTLAIPDNVMKKITRNRDIGLMSNYEFKQYMDEIYTKSVEMAETAQAKAELTDLIFTKRLQKVENYRKALKLPAIEKMTTEQLRQFAEALEPFADGDTFLTERELETVDKTDLKGIRTWREARLKLAQEAGASIAEIEALKVKESDEYRYDTALAESNPFYNLLVTETTRKLMEADARYYDIEKKAHELAKKSNASRQRTIIEKLIPQDKQIMEYLESPAEMKNALASEMTPEQIDYAHFIQEYFGDFLEYLIKIKALAKGRENYFVHMRRTFLEDVKEAGLIKAFPNIFTNYQQDEAVFNIMDEDTGNILPLEKFFQFALHRSGNLEPTANITRAFLTYVRMAEKKRSLDELIPKMDIYAQSLTPQHYTPRGLETDRSMKKFVNKYINNKKGRRIRWIGKQNGKIDMTIRALRTFTSVLDLGLNIPVGIASTIGEQVTGIEVLGTKKYALGTSRLFTEQGRKIVDAHKEFTGKTAWDEIIEPDKQVSERLMEGLFILFRVASVKANQQFLLGSLTEQEFKTGEISSQRLAELKLEMGRWRQTEGSESLVGSTAAGGGAIQYKKWAVPIVRTTAKDISTLVSDLKNKSIGEALTTREAQELKRLIGIVTFATIVGAMMIGDDDDRSFIGQLRAKAYREMMTLMQGVDPKLWLSSPRILTFLAKLGDNLHKILILEEYKTKEGYKGVEGLKKQLTPVVVKQLSEDDNKPQRR